MLTPRYEADDKGNEDGGEGYCEAFLPLLCLTNNTVVSNTWKSCMVVNTEDTKEEEGGTRDDDSD